LPAPWGAEERLSSLQTKGIWLAACSASPSTSLIYFIPDMEGLGIIMAFRKKYPATKIIAMSGGGRRAPDQYLEIAEKLGAQRTF
jgi:beta-phosphoglucomutase-like phosphatase (HAD superfamily)